MTLILSSLICAVLFLAMLVGVGREYSKRQAGLRQPRFDPNLFCGLCIFALIGLAVSGSIFSHAMLR